MAHRVPARAGKKIRLLLLSTQFSLFSSLSLSPLLLLLLLILLLLLLHFHPTPLLHNPLFLSILNSLEDPEAMGCAQGKSSSNSPPRGLEKLKFENGYAGKSTFDNNQRSTDQKFALMESKLANHKPPPAPHRPQFRNYNSDTGGGDTSAGRGGGEGRKITSARKGKRDGGSDGSSRVTITSRGSSMSKSGEDELIGGWPKWLTDNIPREVLSRLVPKSAESYDKIDKVGQGTYSNVYKARDRDTGKIVALKKVRFDASEPESVKFMAREIMMLQKLDHPNIVKLEGLATSRMQFSIYLVFEFMPTDLSRLIARPEGLTEAQIKFYMHQLLSGLQHCHDRGILHRDIKGSNLLIDKNGILKIADFGLANYFNRSSKHPLTNRVVTLWYRAPELLLGSTDYGMGIDLWSAGCLLAEMFTGKPLLPGRNEIEQLHKIFKLCGTPSEEYWSKLKLSTKLRPPHSYKPNTVEAFRDLPESSLGLLRTLLALDPAYRGGASLALQNEFFYKSPLACDLSELPVIHNVEEDESKQVIEQRKLRNSKMKHRYRTQREHRKKDPTAVEPVEDHVFLKESVEKNANWTTTTSSSNSGLNTEFVMNQERSHLLFPSPMASPIRSPRTPYHFDANNYINYNMTKNIAPLSVSRRHNNKDDIVYATSRVPRSVSTREYRNIYRKERLEISTFDD